MLPIARIPGVRRLPQALTRRRDRVVLFDSWRGQYSDNPRAIFEELRRRDAGFEPVWVLKDELEERPEEVVAVEPMGRRHLEYLGRAGYVVCNTNMPRSFGKKRGTTYLQTWHGTPLKRIEFDIEHSAFAGGRGHLRRFRRDVGKWDYLISPNAFSTRIFRQAFHYDGEVLETGYPRNDLLTSPQRGEVRQRVRRELGIADRARAVLYAPTWRDDARAFDPALSLEQLGQALPDHVVLVRAHKLVADTVNLAEGRGLNVSGYPDIRDLYLAADVLVTDYSSVMFDFGVTRKPMLFYTYDLETYRDELRGFYFDFEAQAPGPLLRSTGEVIDALRDLSRVKDAYEDAYESFVQRFCALEDGRAAARVVDTVFGV